MTSHAGNEKHLQEKIMASQTERGLRTVSWGELLLLEPTDAARISSSAQEAWRELRVHHPEVVLSACVQGDGKRLLDFRVSHSDPDIEKWVERTLITEVRSKEICLIELRNTILEMKRDLTDSAFLYLQVNNAISNKRNTNIGFLCNIDHICTDGIGIRAIAGPFFHSFAQRLSSGSHEEKTDLKWQCGASKLSPPWISIMSDKQKTSNVEFETAVTRQFQFQFMSESANNWDLSLHTQPSLQTLGPAFHFLHLTKSQRISLLKAVKSKLGSTATITHLCHAAVVLALVRAFTPPPYYES